MPDLLGFPKVGIWDDAQELFPGVVDAGELSLSPGSVADTWGAGSPDAATLLLQERTGEKSHGSCQDRQGIRSFSGRVANQQFPTAEPSAMSCVIFLLGFSSGKMLQNITFFYLLQFLFC